MKRILAIGLLLVMLMSFAACDDTTDSSIHGESATATVTDNGPEGLKSVLDDIATLQIGTMGVSLSAAAKAVNLLEWCAATALTPDQVADEAAAYLTVLPEESRAVYLEQLLTVTSSCESMMDEEYREYMLLDIGYDPQSYHWDGMAFERINAIIQATDPFMVPVEE